VAMSAYTSIFNASASCQTSSSWYRRATAMPEHSHTVCQNQNDEPRTRTTNEPRTSNHEPRTIDGNPR
jgi:hypothetical protein